MFDFSPPRHPLAPEYRYVLDGDQQNMQVMGFWDDPPSRWAFEQRWIDDDDPRSPVPVPVIIFGLRHLGQRAFPIQAPAPPVTTPPLPTPVPPPPIDRIMAPLRLFLMPLYLIDPWGELRGEPNYNI